MAAIKLRDPVHNFIRLDVEEVKLIDLDVMQRLRGIRQLAMASLVYPGALHTRFDHTLGVAHVAGQMADELGLDSNERTLVRLFCARPLLARRIPTSPSCTLTK